MAKEKKRRGIAFVVVTVLVAVVVVPVSYWVLTVMGERSGIEFSPDDFSMRTFNYNRLPLLNWTHRGIKYTDIESSGKILIDDDWIRITGRTPKRWHLVSERSVFNNSSRAPEDCDARFLTRYFDFSNKDEETLILKWSEANQDAGKIFWPLIAELARDHLYVPIPALIEFALARSSIDDASEFEDELHVLIGDAWYHGAVADRLDGNTSRAARRFRKSFVYVPGYEQIEGPWVEANSETGGVADP